MKIKNTIITRQLADDLIREVVLTGIRVDGTPAGIGRTCAEITKALEAKMSTKDFCDLAEKCEVIPDWAVNAIKNII